MRDDSGILLDFEMQEIREKIMKLKDLGVEIRRNLSSESLEMKPDFVDNGEGFIQPRASNEPVITDEESVHEESLLLARVESSPLQRLRFS